MVIIGEAVNNSHLLLRFYMGETVSVFGISDAEFARLERLMFRRDDPLRMEIAGPVPRGPSTEH
jgi:hypothetical protein